MSCIVGYLGYEYLIHIFYYILLCKNSHKNNTNRLLANTHAIFFQVMFLQIFGYKEKSFKSKLLHFKQFLSANQVGLKGLFFITIILNRTLC